MKLPKHLKTGELCIGFESDILVTDGIGSCVVVCLWDPTHKIGGMAHMFQASRKMIDTSSWVSEGASPDTAIPCLMRRMLELGTNYQDIQARLIGGGNMFSGVENGSPGDIGKKNLDGAINALNKAGLTLNSHSVGGRYGKGLKFTISSGIIHVTLTNGRKVML